MFCQVNNPEAGPVELTGHEGEVTAVDWYVFDRKTIGHCILLFHELHFFL